MILIYVLFMISVTLSVSITLATIVAMLGKILGFAFDDDWRIYRARKNAHAFPKKSKGW